MNRNVLRRTACWVCALAGSLSLFTWPQRVLAADNPALGISEPNIGLRDPNNPEGPCPPPCQDCKSSASPVIIRDGTLFLTFTDLDYALGELPFKMWRRYFSRDWYVGKFGRGWTSPLDIMAMSTITGDVGNEVVVLHLPTGHRAQYVKQPDGSYGSPLGRTGTLTKIAGGYELRQFDGIRYIYDNRARLLRIVDRNDNDVTFGYAGNSRRPTTVTLFNNRVITIAYGANGLVESVTDFSERTVQYMYDAGKRLTGVIDANGQLTQFAYSGDRLTQVTDPLGNVVFTTTYDAQGRVSRTVSEEGDFSYTYSAGSTFKKDNSLAGTIGWTMYYDSLGVITRTTDPAGRNSFRGYDALYYLTSNTDRNNHAATYLRDDRGNILRLTDAEGRVTEGIYLSNLNRPTQTTDGGGVIDKFEYDARGNLTRRIWAFGTPRQAEELFEYDARGNRTRWTDALGYVTTYTYDANNYQTSRTDRENHTWLSTYDTRGNLASTTDPLGNMYSFTYDALNRRMTITDPEGGIVTYGYDAAGHRTSATDRNGRATFFAYDVFGRMTQVTDAAGGVRTMTLDAVGKVLSTVDQRGKYTYLTYDNLHRVNSMIRKVGDTASAPDADDYVTTYTYDFEGNALTEVGFDGNTTTRVYDRTNYVTSKVVSFTGGSESTAWSFNNRGLVASMADGRGRTYTYAYDPVGRLTSLSDNLGVVAMYEYDAGGNRTAAVNAAGARTEYGYDQEHRLTSVTDALGKTIVTVLDAAGQVLELHDRVGGTYTYTRDGSGRVLSGTNQAGETTIYEYDGENNRTRIIDGRGRVTEVDYDALNRPIVTRYADGKSESMAYDPAGNMIMATRRDGTAIAYGYDDVNRLTLIDYPGANDSVLTYGTDGRLASASNSDSVSTYTYTRGGRGETITQDGRTYTMVRDRATGVSDFTYASGLAVKHLSDVRGRLTAIQIGGVDAVTMTYDAVDRFQTRAYANGVSTQFGFNARDDLVQLTHSFSGSDLWSRTMSYRDDARVAAAVDGVETDRSTNLDYDPAGRLTSYLRGVADMSGTVTAPVETIGYAYDAAGNLSMEDLNGTPATRSHDDVNELTSDGTSTYTYDDRGNLLSDGNVTYAYDFDDNLTTVTRISDGAVLLSAKYDALGRRVRTVGPDGTINRHYYVGPNVVEETDDAGVLQRSYVMGENIPEPLIMIQPGDAARYYYLHDAIGSVVALVDNAGAIVEKYLYGPYGDTTVTDAGGSPIADSTVANPWRYAGHRFDGYGGYHMVHRAYLAAMQRFAQFDPLGYIAGPNLYPYAFNDPINFIDPFGLDGWTRFWGGVKMIGGALETVVGVGGVAAGLAAEAPSLGTSTVLVVGGAVATAHGADTFVAGLRQLWTGEEARTLTAQAATALTGSCLAGDLIDAGVGIVASGGVGVASWLSKADKAADVAGLATRGAGLTDDALRVGEGLADDVIEGGVRWGPHTGAGPLGESVAATFRGGSYTEQVTGEATTLYRVWGGRAGELGPYWTRTPPAGPLQSRIDLALRPEWGNTAQNVARIRVPPGTTIFEGFAAPQGGGLLGGGSQVYIPRVDPSWIVP